MKLEMIGINMPVNLNLNFQISDPKQVQVYLASKARRQQLPAAAAPQLGLPVLSGKPLKYFACKLSDAKGQADSSQLLHCCPDCQC